MKYGRTIEIRMPYAQAVPRVKPELEPIAEQAGKGIDAALQELAALG